MVPLFKSLLELSLESKWPTVLIFEFESDKLELIVSMIKYLTKVLEKWPEEVRGSKINPHSDNLFSVREDDDRELLSRITTQGIGISIPSNSGTVTIPLHEGTSRYSNRGIFFDHQSQVSRCGQLG